MVDQALIDSITNRFQQGEKAEEIKEALLNEGWSMGDIEAAFVNIRHNALMQIPMYAKIHAWMDHADQRTSQLPTRTMVQIFIGIALLFIGGVVAMYFFLDPLGLQTSQRDKTREDNAVALREALGAYHKANQVYPNSINQLVPQYLSAIPVDPKTKKPFEYKSLSDNGNYEFCVEFEMQTIRCISPEERTSIPLGDQVIQPTATPIPNITEYQINGQIFLDDNENKIKDEEEETQPDLPIKITDSAKKSVVCETTADSSGIFNCNIPGAGTYQVTLTLPKGMTSGWGNPIEVTLPNEDNPQPTIETLYIGLVK